MIVFNLTTPSVRTLPLNVISPCDDWNNVGVVVRLHQREAFPVVEFAINVEWLDFEAKLSTRPRNPARTYWQCRRRQDGAPPACSVCYEPERTVSRTREMQWFVFGFLEVEAISHQSRLCHCSRAAGADRSRVGGRADEDLVDVFGIKISVLTETHAKCASDCVDEEVKELVIVDLQSACCCCLATLQQADLSINGLCEVLRIWNIGQNSSFRNNRSVGHDCSLAQIHKGILHQTHFG